MKNKKYYTVGTVKKSNTQIAERGQIDTSKAQIQERLLFRLGTATSIKSGELKKGCVFFGCGLSVSLVEETGVPPECPKSLTNFIAKYFFEYTLPGSEFQY